MEHTSSAPNHVGLLYPGIVYDAEGEIHMRTHREVNVRNWPMRGEYWQCFSGGLSELVRGLAQAILKADRRTLPTLRQIEKQAHALHLELLHVRTLKPEEIALHREKVFSLIARLRPLTHSGAKSAARRLCTLSFFRDSQNRLNLGVFRCRMVKVTDELESRLATVLGWRGTFVERYQAMSTLRDEYNHTLREVQKNLKLDLRHELFVKGNTARTQLLRLQDRWRESVSMLHSIKPVRPYNQWVAITRGTLNDLVNMDPNQQALVRAIKGMDRMLAGQELDDLIQRLEMYQYLRLPLFTSVRSEARELARRSLGEEPELLPYGYKQLKQELKDWRGALV